MAAVINIMKGEEKIRMQYNSGNYNKYMSRNPLKRCMAERLNRKIVSNLTRCAS